MADTAGEPAPSSGSTLNEGWDRYDALTTQASASVRAMALAGIAAVWLVTVGTQGSPSILKSAPSWFPTAALAFAVCIAFDILHYAVGGIVLAGWLREPEQKKLGPSGVLPDLPPRVKGPTQFFYAAKIITLFLGYGSLAIGILLNFVF